MNIAAIESGLKELTENPFNKDSFLFDFLSLYDAPKATITKLKQGSSNEASDPGDVLWKKKFFYRVAAKGKSAAEVEKMLFDPLTKKHAPRFLFATDGIEFFARDLKTDVTCEARFELLNNSFDFFLPLAGVERYDSVAENPADIKATARLAKLYDAILEANPTWTSVTHTHELNIFMTRMLFCFFAEDTSIFESALFTSTVLTLTKEDGSDTGGTIELIFDVMNVPEGKRDGYPEYARRFPYVNGGLFASKSHIPKFSAKARRLLKECSTLIWRDINPDIFGSMIQAVVEPEMRSDMGMHYTSVPNIMKVLHPLFLISLEEDFESAQASESKLRKLLERIYQIRVFDPACGSGNFLIIAYKELRKLESRVFEKLKKISTQSTLPMTGIRLSQFFGIEYADFATETAKLSMWIAEYQMNEVFKAEFGSAPPSLPLRGSGNIVHGNACRVDWLKVCPKDDSLETYIVGNPPYLGRAQQSTSQKEDMEIGFSGISTAYKNLDYVSVWVIKGAVYCKETNSQFAFVTTNSICQGEQVALLWPLVINMELEIGFAHQSFKWKNNASANAGVTCVIVGIRKNQKTVKRLFSDGLGRAVKNISPYLIEGNNSIVVKRSSPLSHIPEMDFGSMPNDDGNLILSTEEKNTLIKEHPGSKKFIKSFVGSQEFIKGSERHCLWISDKDLPEALKINEISKRVDKNKAYRSASTRAETRELGLTPHLFGEIRYKESNAIIVPGVSSEKRLYLTVGIVNKDTVISNAAFAIYGAPTYLFAILSSRMHLIWTSSIGGQLESRLRYSATLIYNTFPIPDLTDKQKLELEELTVRILVTRESHIGKTIAELYDAEKMPDDLRACHKELDERLESMYTKKPFKNDSDRLQFLFEQYFLALEKDPSIRRQDSKSQQLSMFTIGD